MRIPLVRRLLEEFVSQLPPRPPTAFTANSGVNTTTATSADGVNGTAAGNASVSSEPTSLTLGQHMNGDECRCYLWPLVFCE